MCWLQFWEAVRSSMLIHSLAWTSASILQCRNSWNHFSFGSEWKAWNSRTWWQATHGLLVWVVTATDAHSDRHRWIKQKLFFFTRERNVSSPLTKRKTVIWRTQLSKPRTQLRLLVFTETSDTDDCQNKIKDTLFRSHFQHYTSQKEKH